MSQTAFLRGFYGAVATGDVARASFELTEAPLTQGTIGKLVPFGEALQPSDVDPLVGFYFLDRIKRGRQFIRRGDKESLRNVQQDMAALIQVAEPEAFPDVAHWILATAEGRYSWFDSPDTVLYSVRAFLGMKDSENPPLRQQQDVVAKHEEPKPEPGAQTKTIKVRVTEEEHARVKGDADKKGLTITGYMRDRLGLPVVGYKRRLGLLYKHNFISVEERVALTLEGGRMAIDEDHYLESRRRHASNNTLYILAEEVRAATKWMRMEYVTPLRQQLYPQLGLHNCKYHERGRQDRTYRNMEQLILKLHQIRTSN